MSSGRHAREARSGGGLVLALIALGLVGLLGWWSVDRFAEDGDGDTASLTTDDGGRSAATDGGAEGSGAEAGREPEGSDARAAVQRCADELADTEHVVRAARSGVRSWRAHTRARTDMLAGRISERTMESIYNRTKRRGHAAQHHFHASTAGLEQRVPCRGLRDVPKRSTDQRTQDCLVRSRAATAALRAARSTLHEWQLHLRHMEEYADGGMSTGKAMSLWVKAWRKAPEGISAYVHRRSDLAQAPPCRPGTDG